MACLFLISVIPAVYGIDPAPGGDGSQAAPGGAPNPASPPRSTNPLTPNPAADPNSGPSDTPATTETLSHAEDPIQKLWEIPVPEPILNAPSPIETSGGDAALVAHPVSGQDPAESPSFRQDPIARTAMYNAQSNAAAFTDGVGGIGTAGDSAFLPAIVNTAGKGFVLGPTVIHPALNVGALYQKSSGASQNDADDGFHPTAGVAFNIAAGQPELRRTVVIDYSGQYKFNEDDSNIRPFTQRFALRSNYGFAKLDVGLGVTYQGLSGENRDIGSQVNQDLLTIALTSTCELTPKANIDLDVAVPIQKYSTGTDSSGVTATTFINFRYTPKTILGVGIAGGLVDVQGGDTQRFVQFLTRGNVATSPEFSFSITLGVELLDAGDSQKVIPIFGLAAVWTPRLGTSFSLTADRRPQNASSNSSENFVSTSVALTATQRLGSWMQMRASFGYENAQYYSIGNSSNSGLTATTVSGVNSGGVFSITTLNQPAPSVDRHDQLFVGQVGLFAELNQRWSAQLQYSYTKNTSNTPDAFDDSRAQFQINFNF